MIKRYKIRIPEDPSRTYKVIENGDKTHVYWRNMLGNEFRIPYTTQDVKRHLDVGLWELVGKPKHKLAKPNLKSPNLFSFDDLD